ncbi:MAG: flagellar basal body-associated protein FliL [Paracoccaceae bacterium]|jgi:flagellar FliL protein|tara:strand:+ start:905 stop:1507 length:603 start_codon:yes stop_codon:yes gene_type:complete
MADEEEPKKKSGLITILIFVVAGFVLVAVGLGVGYLIFGGSNDTPQDIANEIVTKQNGEDGAGSEDEDCEKDEEGQCIEETDPEKISKETPKAEVFQTLYYEIPGSLTTNLKGSRRFLQISVGVSTKYDQKILDNVESHLPSLKAVILAALSDYTEEQVTGREARKLLADDIRDVMNVKLEELEGFGGVEEVLLTSYVMQ